MLDAMAFTSFMMFWSTGCEVHQFLRSPAGVIVTKEGGSGSIVNFCNMIPFRRLLVGSFERALAENGKDRGNSRRYRIPTNLGRNNSSDQKQQHHDERRTGNQRN